MTLVLLSGDPTLSSEGLLYLQTEMGMIHRMSKVHLYSIKVIVFN